MIESIRVLSHKNCGFINFYTQEEAIRAKRACQNKEIMGSGTGTVRIGFAKVPPAPTTAAPSSSSSPTSAVKLLDASVDVTQTLDTLNTPIPNNFLLEDQHRMAYMMDFMNTTTNTNHHTMFSAIVTERKLIMQEFGEDDSDGPIFDGKSK